VTKDRHPQKTSDASTARHYLEDTQTERLSVLEPIWSRLRREAEAHITDEPELAAFLTANVLRFHSFDHALSEHLGAALGEPTHPARLAQALLASSFGRSLALCTEIAEDFDAALRDRSGPSWSILLQDLGFRALVVHRIAGWLGHTARPVMAAYLAGRAAEVFGVAVELGATLAGGIVVSPGVFISRDSVIGQGVRLGRNAVVHAAVVGQGATILPGSVVTSTVQSGAMMAGIPARRIGTP
jgi:serine O-acetyltransferase